MLFGQSVKICLYILQLIIDNNVVQKLFYFISSTIYRIIRSEGIPFYFTIDCYVVSIFLILSGIGRSKDDNIQIYFVGCY